uniref:Uncharacterized protein n=1 Tax=Candidatus Kentrum sp. LFY TaxID=2126342 RepID=A0A450V8Q9_9GAMM|nr:MAG: hypothetical protein BECKLFY1418B_GA0070995_12331 [Candidatus Kentron sp. LFY]
MTVGDKAMQEASQVYTHLKTAAETRPTTPGIKPVALQLDERFRQAKKKRSPMRWRSKAPGIGRNRVRRFNNEPPNLDTLGGPQPLDRIWEEISSDFGSSKI